MQCNKIMSQDVQWIAPNDSVAYAAQLMAFHNLGFLPVCNEEGRPLGVITDRDIALRVVGEDRPVLQTKVADIMTYPIHSVTADYSLQEAGEVMQKSGLSRLLVLDESSRLTGVLGIADIIVRGPGRTALGIARGIYARETAIKSKNLPRPAESPTPEFFHGRRDTSALQPGSDTSPNAARLEAEHVVRGGVNELKEFPS